MMKTLNLRLCYSIFEIFLFVTEYCEKLTKLTLAHKMADSIINI